MLILNEKQKYASAGVAAFSLTLAALFSTQLPKGGPMIVVAAVAAAIILNLSAASRKKPTLWYSMGIFLICLPVLYGQASLAELVKAMSRFLPVMGLLVGIALFRHSLLRSGLAALISRPLLGPVDTVQNSVRVSVATAGLSVFGSLGTISIICAALSARVHNKLALSSIAVRALCSSMYILPTTVASAAVAAAIPHLDAGRIALLGAPLTLVMLLGAMLPQLQVAAVGSADKPVPVQRPLALVALVVLCGALAIKLTGQVTVSIAVAMMCGYLLERFVFSRNMALPALKEEMARSLDGIAPELLLLAGSGLLIFTVQRLNLPAHLTGAFVTAMTDRNIALLLLLVVFPLISIAGLHPLVLFGIFFPLIQPVMFHDPSIQYLAWTSTFVMSNLLSPVSTCAMLAATSLQKTTRETSYLSNGRYCTGLALLTAVYLTVLALPA